MYFDRLPLSELLAEQWQRDGEAAAEQAEGVP